MTYCSKLYFDCKGDNIKEITNEIVLRDPRYNEEIQERHQFTVKVISNVKISGQLIHHTTTARNTDYKKFYYYYLFYSFLVVVSCCNLIAMFVFLWFTGDVK